MKQTDTEFKAVAEGLVAVLSAVEQILPQIKKDIVSGKYDDLIAAQIEKKTMEVNNND